jgi:hypothetical protein
MGEWELTHHSPQRLKVRSPWATIGSRSPMA